MTDKPGWHVEVTANVIDDTGQRRSETIHRSYGWGRVEVNEFTQGITMAVGAFLAQLNEELKAELES